MQHSGRWNRLASTPLPLCRSGVVLERQPRMAFSVQMDEFRLSNSRKGANWAQNVVGPFTVKTHQRNSFRPPGCLATAQREGSDVNAVLAQRSANETDDSRFIMVAQVENGAVEMCFQRNSVDLDHAR